MGNLPNALSLSLCRSLPISLQKRVTQGEGMQPILFPLYL